MTVRAMESIYLTCRLANKCWKCGIGTVLVPELLAADNGLSSFNSYFGLSLIGTERVHTKSKRTLVFLCSFCLFFCEKKIRQIFFFFWRINEKGEIKKTRKMMSIFFLFRIFCPKDLLWACVWFCRKHFIQNMDKLFTCSGNFIIFFFYTEKNVIYLQIFLVLSIASKLSNSNNWLLYFKWTKLIAFRSEFSGYISNSYTIFYEWNLN